MTGAWEVVFYETAGGANPVRQYIDGLSAAEAARVVQGLALLQQFGTALGPPHVRHLRDKLWELRIPGRIQHRVLYFAATGRRMVLLHAFTKRTQKTPRGEIETALRRMDDYQARVRT